MLPIKPRVLTMFAQGEGHTDDLVCKLGGAAPPPTPLFLRPNPPRFLKAMDACKRKQESGRRQHRCLQQTSIRSSPCGSFMFALRESYAGHFVCKWGGGLRTPQPPLLKALDACKRKQESGRRQHRCLHQKTSIRSSPCGSFMFALGESYAGHVVCKWGGCAPPNPPAF